MEIYIVIAVVIILILFYFWYYKQNFNAKSEPVIVEKKIVRPPELTVEKDWNDVMIDVNLEPGVVDSHAQYNANVRQFSSGANFSAISDDNTSPIFTNFVGFSRPQFVEIDSTARQIPDIDHNVLKRNKRLTFTNDYDL